MASFSNFYIDDSGTRKPNRHPLSFDPPVRDFFALGGVLIDEEDEAAARNAHATFCAKWGITYPLHSVEIRHCAQNFSWLVAGAPFEQRSSSLYSPLSGGEFRETLHDLAFKQKSSPMAQIADLFLWPMAIGAYDAGYRAYVALRDAGRLIEEVISAPDHAQRGTKYSCFELVREYERCS